MRLSQNRRMDGPNVRALSDDGDGDQGRRYVETYRVRPSVGDVPVQNKQSTLRGRRRLVEPVDPWTRGPVDVGNGTADWENAERNGA